jgi:hypothetical protein
VPPQHPLHTASRSPPRSLPELGRLCHARKRGRVDGPLLPGVSVLVDGPKGEGLGRRHFRLAIYCLTCRHRNLEGLYRLPLSYAATDLGWTPRKATKALERLVADGFVEYDSDAEVVFVRNALKYQAPKSGPQVTGAVRALSEVPPTRLRDAFLQAVDVHAPELATALDGHPEPLPMGIDTHSKQPTPTPALSPEPSLSPAPALDGPGHGAKREEEITPTPSPTSADEKWIDEAWASTDRNGHVEEAG